MSSTNRIVEDLEIEGMSCGHCVDAVDGALRNVEEVVVERIAIGGARINYPARAVLPEQIEAAISRAGFRLRGTRQIA